MGRIAVFLSIFFLAITRVFSATISGIVQAQMEKNPLQDALVILHSQKDKIFIQSVVSDAKGYFIFTNVAVGVYNIEAVKDGFYKNILFDLKVDNNQDHTVSIKLLKQERAESSEYCFMLGGIEVRSEERALIPEEPMTVRRINSGEIEHLQATNLGDVLSLVPGIEQVNNPGLSSLKNISIRSIHNSANFIESLESFGTTIIVDGNRLVTDANANNYVNNDIFDGTRGLDLRNVPADNIKFVEVITGVPSVEYGNFADGIVKVETKSGRIAPKLKAKLNPDTKTVSFIHGLDLGSTVLDYYLNYGYSERDLREEGDEYQRIHLDGNLSRLFFNDRLDVRLKGSYTRTFDDDAPVGIYHLINYNRGYITSSNLNFDYQQSESSHWIGYFSFNLNRKNVFRERWVVEQVAIDSNTVLYYNGIALTDTVLSGFRGALRKIGHEWAYRGKIQHKGTFRKFGAEHNSLLGLELDFQKNTGAGLVLDTPFNYYGFYSTQRSYRYDDYPQLDQWSIYAEDIMIHTLFGRRSKLMFGLRYDVFNPIGLNEFGDMLSEKVFIKSRHGDFLSPRINWQYFVTQDLRLRLGAGRNAKAVSLAYMFREPKYYKYQSGDQIIEEMQIQHNPNLQTYTVEKYEASIDWQVVQNLGISLTGYFSESDDRPYSTNYPWGYQINPDTITSAFYSIYENRGWYESSGMEFTLRTRRIHNLQYRMNLTYRFSKSGLNGLMYDSTPDTSSGETIWFLPAWQWREKVIIDYQINYISRRLGIWATLDIQHIPLEHCRNVYQVDAYQKEIDGVLYDWYQQMGDWFKPLLYNTGGRWLLNLRITKSLSTNTEMSLYINNILDDRARWENFLGFFRELNPPIYYGLEVSTQW